MTALEPTEPQQRYDHKDDVNFKPSNLHMQQQKQVVLVPLLPLLAQAFCFQLLQRVSKVNPNCRNLIFL